MKKSQIAKYIVLACILSIGVISVSIIIKTIRPSPGKRFEQLTMQQAEEYMKYEIVYTLVDIGTEEEYREDHIEGSVNIPYETLTGNAVKLLPDKDSQVYICGRDRELNEKAAAKLVKMGYTNVAEIGLISEWVEMTEE